MDCCHECWFAGRAVIAVMGIERRLRGYKIFLDDNIESAVTTKADSSGSIVGSARMTMEDAEKWTTIAIHVLGRSIRCHALSTNHPLLVVLRPIAVSSAATSLMVA